jgi:hypothetical protein
MEAGLTEIAITVNAGVSTLTRSRPMNYSHGVMPHFVRRALANAALPPFCSSATTIVNEPL